MDRIVVCPLVTLNAVHLAGRIFAVRSISTTRIHALFYRDKSRRPRKTPYEEYRALFEEDSALFEECGALFEEYGIFLQECDSLYVDYSTQRSTVRDFKSCSDSRTSWY